jgi:hypothetical protein
MGASMHERVRAARLKGVGRARRPRPRPNEKRAKKNDEKKKKNRPCRSIPSYIYKSE